MKMLDLRKHNGRYYFRLDSSDDFWDTIRLLKATFQPRERDYNPDTREWSVPISAQNGAKLAAIFNNARDSFTYLKAQTRMF